MSKESLKEAISFRNQIAFCALLCIGLSCVSPFIGKGELPDIVPIVGGILTVCWINMIKVVRTLKRVENND